MKKKGHTVIYSNLQLLPLGSKSVRLFFLYVELKRRNCEVDERRLMLLRFEDHAKTQ